MASSTILPLLSLVILFLLSYSHRLAATVSIHELLPQFGLPNGLFPDSVKNYTFSPEDGSLIVELEKQPCYVHLKEKYLMSYDELIYGTLKLGSLTNLEGVRVKWLLLWLKVDVIQVDLPPNDNIYLQFGLDNKMLDVHQFQTIQSCSYQKMKMFKQFQPQAQQVDEVSLYAIQ